MEQAAPARSGSAWAARLRALAPHALTAVVAVLASLGIQAALLTPAAPPAPTALPALTPTAAAEATSAPPPPSATPAPTALPPAAGITRQELLDLRAENDRIWSAIYLSRAISQIADAETALRENNLERVDQMLVATDDSLALAYGRTSDALRDPIAQLRRDAGGLREDLYLRPEGMDVRLVRLRQTLLALIAERR